jgi:hypothetical protein
MQRIVKQQKSYMESLIQTNMEYCVCRHPKPSHLLIEDWCQSCSNEYRENDYIRYRKSLMFHKFKLDNLKLIEDLAKERKLI